MKYLSLSIFTKGLFSLVGMSSLVFAMDFDDINIQNLKLRKGEVMLTVEKIYEQKGITSTLNPSHLNSVKNYIDDLFQNLEKKR